MTRRYGRAPRGQRSFGQVPRNYGTRTTLIGAITLTGMGPAMTLPGAVDTAAFTAYVAQILCPALRPGQVVVMDNLSSHVNEAIREYIEAAGCALLLLPRYSPDFNPIELAFAKIKGILRTIEARTAAGLEAAIAIALDTITAADASGWFQHCGYLTQRAT